MVLFYHYKKHVNEVLIVNQFTAIKKIVFAQLKNLVAIHLE